MFTQFVRGLLLEPSKESGPARSAQFGRTRLVTRLDSRPVGRNEEEIAQAPETPRTGFVPVLEFSIGGAHGSGAMMPLMSF